jgi:hypothetical protein
LVFHTVLSGTRVELKMLNSAVATTGSLEFPPGSVAFWQATKTNNPTAKVAKGRSALWWDFIRVSPMPIDDGRSGGQVSREYRSRGKPICEAVEDKVISIT